MRFASCHPDRKHCAKGLCRKCYRALPDQKAAQRACDARRPPRRTAECKAYQAAYKAAHPPTPEQKRALSEYQARWYAAHKAAQAERRAVYSATHKAEAHANYVAHRAERVAYHARRRGQPGRREAALAYMRTRRKTVPTFKICCNLRERLNKALRNGQRAGSAVRDLGCSLEHLKLHLELFWDEGMTWENWTYRGWHIDHIKPLASFDLTDRKQFLEANHFTNLQPLWHIDNFRKGARAA